MWNNPAESQELFDLLADHTVNSGSWPSLEEKKHEITGKHDSSIVIIVASLVCRA